MVNRQLSLVALAAVLLVPAAARAQVVRPAIIGIGARPFSYYNPFIYTGGFPGYGLGLYYPSTYSYAYSPSVYTGPLTGYHNLSPYAYGYAPYSVPTTGLVPAASTSSYSYSVPARYEPIYAAAEVGGRDLAAHLIVRVPTANARLWVEGVELREKGTVRRFVSPRLQPNAKYGYTIKAEWKANGKVRTQAQDVVVRAGERLRVNFPKGK